MCVDVCLKNFLIYIAIHNFYFMANNRYQKVFLFVLRLQCVFLVHIAISSSCVRFKCLYFCYAVFFSCGLSFFFRSESKRSVDFAFWWAMLSLFLTLVFHLSFILFSLLLSFWLFSSYLSFLFFLLSFLLSFFLSFYLSSIPLFFLPSISLCSHHFFLSLSTVI